MTTTTTILRTVAEAREELAGHRARGRTIALVPTMGALHEGHLSLIRLAREHADVVGISIFVNPAQFNDEGDLAAYPRTEERDVELAGNAGPSSSSRRAPRRSTRPGSARACR